MKIIFIFIDLALFGVFSPARQQRGGVMSFAQEALVAKEMQRLHPIRKKKSKKASPPSVSPPPPQAEAKG